VHEVPFGRFKQYPNVPRSSDPLIFSTLSEALRKYCDFRSGALKETTASRIVAMSVTRKPGVAGLNIIAQGWCRRRWR